MLASMYIITPHQFQVVRQQKRRCRFIEGLLYLVCGCGGHVDKKLECPQLYWTCAHGHTKGLGLVLLSTGYIQILRMHRESR